MNNARINAKIYELTVLLFLLTSLTVSANEFWISPRAPTLGVPSGTVSNPLDGSTCTNFDFNMNSLPPYAIIHVMPGTYQTLGGNGWGPKTGQQIRGSGMDVTIFQFPSNAVASGALFNGWVITPQSPYHQTNITVSDLTLDCNYQPGTITTLNGIYLAGSGNTIQRVKLINAASFTRAAARYFEAWGIIIGASPFPQASGNLIDSCVVSNYYGNYHNNLSAMGLLENSSGIVSHNLIVQTGSNYMLGIYLGSHDSVMSDNIMQNVSVGSHYDSGTGVTNATIINNQFINCSCAIDWYNACFEDVSIAFNNIVLTNDGSGNFSTEAIFFNPSPSVFNRISIYGNTVSVAGTNHFNDQRFILAYNSHGLQIHNNRVDSNLPSLFVSCSGVVKTNNYDLTGNPYGLLTPPGSLAVGATNQPATLLHPK